MTASRQYGALPDRARHARDALARRLAGQPGVSGIDIGADPLPGDGGAEPAVVLRVHLSSKVSAAALDLPAAIDGIPVRVVTGDYRPE